jgi:hypothetical protein
VSGDEATGIRDGARIEQLNSSIELSERAAQRLEDEWVIVHYQDLQRRDPQYFDVVVVDLIHPILSPE